MRSYGRSSRFVALLFPATHGEALEMLGPIKVGREFRYSLSCSVADSEMLADVTARGKMVFEGACVSCHGWTGESAISPFATLTGAWAVNEPAATNVAQIVISGTKRHAPSGVISMSAFGNVYSGAEIAAIANYLTARFGSKGSQITARDVAELRKQTPQ